MCSLTKIKAYCFVLDAFSVLILLIYNGVKKKDHHDMYDHVDLTPVGVSHRCTHKFRLDIINHKKISIYTLLNLLSKRAT